MKCKIDAEKAQKIQGDGEGICRLVSFVMWGCQQETVSMNNGARQTKERRVLGKCCWGIRAATEQDN